MDNNMKQSDDSHYIPMTSFSSGTGHEVAPDVYYYTDQIVNLVFVGQPGNNEWVLIDAGMPSSGKEIAEVAEKKFGKGSRPDCILLTHGHFDHVGSIVHLLRLWDNVPVYAHPLEFPFLTGQQSYPEPDTSVEGGMLAKISSLYPNEPINIAPVLRELPMDGNVPGLQDWKWMHVPGHSPGQVAFFRERDRLLVSADAFVTVRQDEFYKVLTQKKEVNGPPRYLTTDWQAAWDSVRRLEALNPAIVVPGHGTYMEGEELTEGLRKLVAEFDTLAIPDHGKFVHDKSNYH